MDRSQLLRTSLKNDLQCYVYISNISNISNNKTVCSLNVPVDEMSMRLSYRNALDTANTGLHTFMFKWVHFQLTVGNKFLLTNIACKLSLCDLSRCRFSLSGHPKRSNQWLYEYSFVSMWMTFQDITHLNLLPQKGHSVFCCCVNELCGWTAWNVCHAMNTGMVYLPCEHSCTCNSLKLQSL